MARPKSSPTSRSSETSKSKPTTPSHSSKSLATALKKPVDELASLHTWPSTTAKTSMSSASQNACSKTPYFSSGSRKSETSTGSSPHLEAKPTPPIESQSTFTQGYSSTPSKKTTSKEATRNWSLQIALSGTTSTSTRRSLLTTSKLLLFKSTPHRSFTRSLWFPEKP